MHSQAWICGTFDLLRWSKGGKKMWQYINSQTIADFKMYVTNFVILLATIDKGKFHNFFDVAKNNNRRNVQTERGSETRHMCQ